LTTFSIDKSYGFGNRPVCGPYLNPLALQKYVIARMAIRRQRDTTNKN
jgi:hypothetical protein